MRSKSKTNSGAGNVNAFLNPDALELTELERAA